MREPLATFDLQILSPEVKDGRWSDQDKRVLADLPAYMEEMEENLTDLLPEGYSARITEWSSDD